MPIAQLFILEGRTTTQKNNLIREVTEAMSRSIDAPIERIRVIITEMPKGNFGIAGESAAVTSPPTLEP
ncbi:2-hydroxymuconate tautomerase [Zhongshania marina]|uniref:Tautomerase n=1 Tax=Zhongshania marina TaxID=2304603 RepID=A0ABX9VZ41_9GAMM|nr:4-oxalocrotonate tautomerase family protein [Zhongshania marina]